MKQAMQVLTSRATDEWYTPVWIVNAARRVLGTIDLDPASSAIANQTVQATNYYDTDGLKHCWYGRVWLNPPFSQAREWSQRLVRAYAQREIEEAILLVNANLGYNWFEVLWTNYPVCLLRQRVQFVRPDGTVNGQAKKASALLYFGDNVTRFSDIFALHGRVIYP